jgi:hypothetical protein
MVSRVIVFRAFRVSGQSVPIVYGTVGEEVLIGVDRRLELPDIAKEMSEMGTELASAWIGPNPGPYRVHFRVTEKVNPDRDLAERHILPYGRGTVIVYTVQPVDADDALMAMAEASTGLTRLGWAPVPVEALPVG